MNKEKLYNLYVSTLFNNSVNEEMVISIKHKLVELGYKIEYYTATNHWLNDENDSLHVLKDYFQYKCLKLYTPDIVKHLLSMGFHLDFMEVTDWNDEVLWTWDEEEAFSGKMKQSILKKDIQLGIE